jgi:predicted outer membrane repeat protein
LFVACKSKNGSGGALYLSCSHSNIVKSNDILDKEVCIHYITKNTFKDNEAAGRGGAIFYETNAPLNIKKNSYINNRAPFGGNYSSFPEKAAFVRINEEGKEVITLDDEFTSIVSWIS